MLGNIQINFDIEGSALWQMWAGAETVKANETEATRI